jgi:hypothetical protein
MHRRVQVAFSYVCVTNITRQSLADQPGSSQLVTMETWHDGQTCRNPRNVRVSVVPDATPSKSGMGLRQIDHPT